MGKYPEDNSHGGICPWGKYLGVHVQGGFVFCNELLEPRLLFV